MSQEPPTPPLPRRDELARRILVRSTHSDTALLVLMIIALYSNDAGETAITVVRLAKLTRHTKSHIASHVLPELRASGELVQVRSGNTGGAPPHPNVYRIAERLYI